MAEIDLGKVANDISDNGSYNLLPFPYPTSNGYNGYGIEFKYDEEGIITLNGSNANKQTTFFDLLQNDWSFTLEPGTYILDGGFSQGSNGVYLDGTTYPGNSYWFHNGTAFTVTSTVKIKIYFYIPVGASLTNFKAKPMLLKADDNGNYPTTYMRGSIMSNRKLSDAIGSKTLNTTAKTLSGAINEHEQNIVDLDTKVGAAALNTTAQDLSSAINEVNGKFKKHFVGTAIDSTTNDAGCITLGLNVTSDHPNGIVVDCVYVTDYVAIPFLWNNNRWYAKILSPWASTAAILSTAIGEATFTYYDL